MLARSDLALADFNHAIALNRKCNGFRARGGAFLNLRRVQAALQDFNRADRSRSELCRCVQRPRRRLFAVAGFPGGAGPGRRALRLKPDNANYRAVRGNIYSRWDVSVRPLRIMIAVLATNADNISALAGRAQSFAALGQFARAIDDYDRLAGLLPGSSQVYFYRASQYLSLGDYARAVEDYDRAIMLQPGVPVVFNNRCWARALWGRYLEAAEADCYEALALAPNDPKAEDSLGLVHYRMGAYAKATADYAAALAVDAKSASSLYMRGLLRLSGGDRAGGYADLAASRAIARRWKSITRTTG